MPSISVLLHEVIKLLFYARCRHVKLIRIGTCGGLGLVPGTVVVSEMVVNEAFEPVYQVVCNFRIGLRHSNINPT